MEKDSLRNMLYALSRFGLFWLVNIFGVIIGKTAILGAVGTFIPRLQLYDNPELLSLISWLIPSVMLIALFADDAKRHTAYQRYNSILVSMTIILTCAVYYIPAIVIGYITDPKTASFLKELYFTAYWMSLAFGDNVEVYALIDTVIKALICIVSYMLARKIYLKKFENGEYEYEV